MRFLNESAAAGSREKGCECHDRACRGQVMRTACIEYLMRPMQPLGCSEPLIGTMHEPGMPFLQNTNNQRVTLFEGVKPPTAAPQQQIRMMLDQYSDARPVLLWGLKQLPPGSAIACCHSTVSFSTSIHCEHQISGNSKLCQVSASVWLLLWLPACCTAVT